MQERGETSGPAVPQARADAGVGQRQAPPAQAVQPTVVDPHSGWVGCHPAPPLPPPRHCHTSSVAQTDVLIRKKLLSPSTSSSSSSLPYSTSSPSSPPPAEWVACVEDRRVNARPRCKPAIWSVQECCRTAPPVGPASSQRHAAGQRGQPHQCSPTTHIRTQAAEVGGCGWLRLRRCSWPPGGGR